MTSIDFQSNKLLSTFKKIRELTTGEQSYVNFLTVLIDTARGTYETNAVFLHGTEIHWTTYKPVAGSSYAEYPDHYSHAKLKRGGVVNIKNHDQMCFLYSILCSLQRAEKDPQRVRERITFI